MWKTSLLGMLLVSFNILGMEVNKRPDVFITAYNNLSFNQKQDLSQVLIDVKNGNPGPFAVLNDDMSYYHRVKRNLKQNANSSLSKLKPASNAVFFSYGRDSDPKNGFSVVLGSYSYLFTTQFIQNYVNNETDQRMIAVYDSMFME